MAKLSKKQNQNIFYSLTILVIVSGFLFWTSDLRSDPPMHFSGLGQSLSTDPAQYFHHARNAVLFDDFNIENYDRWTVYQHSLISGISFLWFSITEVSHFQAGLISVILSFASLILLILSVNKTKKIRPWVTTAIALSFVINVTLITHGRLTYLENGLIFFTSLLFFIYSKWGDKTWGIVLASAVIALATLTGKLFGLLLLPALLLTLFFRKEKNYKKTIMISIGSFFGAIIITTLVLYGTDVSSAFSYITEQSYGLRGFPEGLKTPWGFVEHFISYGNNNHLYYINPDIFAFFVFSGFGIVILLGRGKKFKNFPPITILSLFTTLIFLIGLMPLNYSPIRYATVLIPAIIILCFTLMDRVHLDYIKAKVRLTKPQLALTGLMIWFLSFHLIANIFYFNVTPFPTRMLTWLTLPLALLGVYFIYYASTSIRKKIISKPILTASISLLVLFSITTNSFRVNRILYSDTNYNIQEANLDISQILGEGALVSGPYAPLLTANNNVRSFIHLFGVSNLDSTLFDKQPITHLAVDQSNWTLAIKDYPALADLNPLTTYWIRDYEVRLYNISDVFRNETANNYQETNFEIALKEYYNKNNDSAFVYLKQFVDNHPDSKSGNILLIDILSSQNKVTEVYNTMIHMAEIFPTDFFIQIQCGRFIQMMGLSNKDNSLIELSKKYYERATKVNRFKATYANNLFLETMKQFDDK